MPEVRFSEQMKVILCLETFRFLRSDAVKSELYIRNKLFLSDNVKWLSGRLVINAVSEKLIRLPASLEEEGVRITHHGRW